MKKKMIAAVFLAAALPAIALCDVIVETPDGFRRAAQDGGQGNTLLMMQERKDVDGLIANVGARLTLSSAAGEALWTQVIGGDGDDMLSQAVWTGEGWLAVGASSSSDLGEGWHDAWYDVYEPKTDGWIVRLDREGSLLWSRCLGGMDTDAFYGVCEAWGGGYVIVGETYSGDGDVVGWHDSGELFRQPDGWVVCVDEAGEVLWQRCLGGSGYDVLRGIVPVEGGYLCVGETDSQDGDVSGGHGDRDGWVVYVDTSGEVMAQYCYGGGSEDALWAVTSGEEGILAVGYGWFENQGEGEQRYNSNGWALALTETGEQRWQVRFGVDDNHHARYVEAGNAWHVAGFTQMNGYELHWVVEIPSDGTDWQVIRSRMGETSL